MTIAAVVQDLCDIIEAENAALGAMDLRAATALVPAKQAATEALAGIPAVAMPVDDQALREAVTRLRALAATNRTLLERALVAQDRVLACIARAMPRALSQGGRYGARGVNVAGAALPPVALSARA